MRRSERGKKAHRRGLAAETIAAWYLRLKGYRIHARRLRTPVGELDIVASRGGTLVFFEVKARGSIELAGSVIDARAIGRLTRAAAWYQARYRHPHLDQVRLDMLLLSPARLWPVHVRGDVGAHGALAGGVA